jgi:hypothetical protein
MLGETKFAFLKWSFDRVQPSHDAPWLLVFIANGLAGTRVFIFAYLFLVSHNTKLSKIYKQFREIALVLRNQKEAKSCYVSSQCCGSGSGIQPFFDLLDPESFLPDPGPGSQISLYEITKS